MRYNLRSALRTLRFNYSCSYRNLNIFENIYSAILLVEIYPGFMTAQSGTLLAH